MRISSDTFTTPQLCHQYDKFCESNGGTNYYIDVRSISKFHHPHFFLAPAVTLAEVIAPKRSIFNETTTLQPCQHKTHRIQPCQATVASAVVSLSSTMMNHSARSVLTSIHFQPIRFSATTMQTLRERHPDQARRGARRPRLRAARYVGCLLMSRRLAMTSTMMS